MLNDITFGQYFPSGSLLHRFDPRLKTLLLITNIVSVFLINSTYSLICALIFTLLVVILSKIPLKMYLKNIKAIIPILLFTFLLNLFYFKSGDVLLDWWIFNITLGGLFKAIFMSLRVILFIVISSVLTYTTTPNDITDALESILSPLKFLGLGSVIHTLVMIMTITLRFIPALIEETQKIINAQKARGADFETGNFFDKIKALIPILIPLFVVSFRRAYDLAYAMESRCYNGGIGKTRMKKFKIRFTDIIIVAVNLIFCASFIVLNHFDFFVW